MNDGYKPYRFADAVEYDSDGNIVVIYQVGKVNKNGSIISREIKAMMDISKSKAAQGVPIYFKPYNTDEDYLILFEEDE